MRSQVQVQPGPPLRPGWIVARGDRVQQVADAGEHRAEDRPIRSSESLSLLGMAAAFLALPGLGAGRRPDQAASGSYQAGRSGSYSAHRLRADAVAGNRTLT
jgi:hypothetical protein